MTEHPSPPDPLHQNERYTFRIMLSMHARKKSLRFSGNRKPRCQNNHSPDFLGKPKHKTTSRRFSGEVKNTHSGNVETPHATALQNSRLCHYKKLYLLWMKVYIKLRLLQRNRLLSELDLHAMMF